MPEALFCDGFDRYLRIFFKSIRVHPWLQGKMLLQECVFFYHNLINVQFTYKN